MLWFSTTYSIFYTTIQITIMNCEEFVDTFGLQDFNQKKNASEVSFTDLIKAKPVRIFKECFSIYSHEEFKNPKVRQRMYRHKFFVNLFENLPQSVL